MVMGVDQARHDDAIDRIDDRGPVSLDVGADRSDALAFHQHISLRKIRGLLIHGDDDAALEKRAPFALRTHSPCPSSCSDGSRAEAYGTGPVLI